MASSYTISRTIRICRWEARVNSLWLWAYCLLTMCLHGYLMYRAVSKCKDYNELPWRTNDKPVVELYVYISLIVLSVMCVPFFIITSIFKVGNFSGDGVRLGRDNIHEQELAEAASMATMPTSSLSNDTQKEIPIMRSQRSLANKLHALWRHIGPFSHGFHLVSAFSLLLPSILLEAQEIRYGFRNPDIAWRSDLDWMFRERRYDVSQSGAPIPQADVVQYSSADSTSLGPLVNGDVLPAGDVRIQSPSVISPEYINYILALVIYGVRYAAVFWYTKMSFSIIFMVLLLVITLYFGFSFCGVAILYKFQSNPEIFREFGLVLPAAATMCLYLLANSLLLLSFLSVFKYGLQHYTDSWQKFLKSYAPMYCKRHNKSRGYHSYIPHTMASVLLLLVVLCRGGIVYDYVIVYRKTGFPIILACIVMDAVYMVSWIAFWFALTLKQSWNFRIMFARYVMPSPVTPARTNGINARDLTSSSDITSRVMSSQEEASTNSSVTASHGNTLNLEIDTVDASVDVHSPSGGMLRNGKHRRSAPKQRVKFDESAAGAGHKNERKSKSSGNNSLTDDVFDDEPGSLRRAYSESSSRGKNRKKDPRDSSSDEYVTESTPENTLTRTYRHSIRDTCGLYFRISREISPPPAAHSSPVPSEKRPIKPINQTPIKLPPDELLLDPLKADRQYPQSYSGAASDSTMSNSYSPGDSSVLAIPINYSPNDSGVHLRHNHPRDTNDPGMVHHNAPRDIASSGVPLRHNGVRDRGPTKADNRYSYPMTVQHDSLGEGEYQHSPRGLPPTYPHGARHSMNLDRSRVHDGSYLGNGVKPNQRSRNITPWSPDGPVRSHESSRQRRSTSPAPPPRPPRNHDTQGYGHPREVTIVNKPDLSHRDSALPSSNETSSSDSNDVLCSQV